MDGSPDTAPPFDCVAQFRRVAVVHDWLVVFAGAETVLREILHLFPQSDLFAMVDFLSDADRAKLSGRRARTSFIQKLPFAKQNYRHYLPLMPLAVEQFDLSGYDLVISSSHAVAKGVITGPGQLHVCYCYTPIRYAWDMQHEYLREAGLRRGVRSVLARVMLHYIRNWDARTAFGVDAFITSSAYVAQRIHKVYKRRAMVVYPPVNLAGFAVAAAKQDFYLTASRLVPYKRIQLIVEAFATMPEKRLVVIGDGPEHARIRAAAGPNVTVLGYQPDEGLRDHLQRARAFIFAAEEDFGILPLEAQACGTPVLAFGRGGALETVVDAQSACGAQPTGMFFHAQDVASLRAAVARFEAAPRIDPAACRAQAEKFSPERFREAFMQAIAIAVRDRTKSISFIPLDAGRQSRISVV